MQGTSYKYTTKTNCNMCNRVIKLKPHDTLWGFVGLLGLQMTRKDPLPLSILELDGREPVPATHAVLIVRWAFLLANMAVALATRLEQGEALSLVGLHAVAVELVHPFAVQASGGGISA